MLGFSRARVETERWTAFRSHYGIEPFYCQPGLGGAHEKGGVEGDIGRFRRNHLVPVPEVARGHAGPCRDVPGCAAFSQVMGFLVP